MWRVVAIAAHWRRHPHTERRTVHVRAHVRRYRYRLTAPAGALVRIGRRGRVPLVQLPLF